MSRKVFESISDIKEWAKAFATPERYIVNITRDKEIIIEPTKSTRPLTYCYYKVGYGEEEEKHSSEFLKYLKDRGFVILRLKAYEWDVDKMVGVKVKVED